MAKKTTTAAGPKKLTKTELVKQLMEKAGLEKKQVEAMLASLEDVIREQLTKRGAPGELTLPGLMKIRKVRKKATKARKGRNPRTGEETTIAAKPAHDVVKVTPLKNLKDMVQKK